MSKPYYSFGPDRADYETSGVHVDHGIDKYYTESGGECIRLRGRPDQFAQWAEMNDTGFLVPAVLKTGEDIDPEDFTLVMPVDARSIESQLHILKRNIDAYSEIFFLVGYYLKAMNEKLGYGFVGVENRAILSSFYTKYSQQSSSGIDILLAPPYMLGDVTIYDTVSAIRINLETSGYFTPGQANVFLEAIDTGVYCYDEQ